MSYQTLLAIYETAAEEYERYKYEEPVRCPNDNTLLINVDGILFCRFDGWTWNGVNTDSIV